MLKNIVFGTMLHKELRGIDDPALVASIRRACLWRSDSIAPALALAIAVGACSGVIIGVLRDTLGWPGWRFGSFFSGASATLAVSMYLRRRAMKLLPEMLRSMGRCTRCGYKLEESGKDKCPECGHPW